MAGCCFHLSANFQATSVPSVAFTGAVQEYHPGTRSLRDAREQWLRNHHKLTCPSDDVTYASFTTAGGCIGATEATSGMARHPAGPPFLAGQASGPDQ